MSDETIFEAFLMPSFQRKKEIMMSWKDLFKKSCNLCKLIG